MRKCKKCGCYLPDLFTKCLACGYENNPNPLSKIDSSSVVVANNKPREYIGYSCNLPYICDEKLCDDCIFLAIDERKIYRYRSGIWVEA